MHIKSSSIPLDSLLSRSTGKCLDGSDLDEIAKAKVCAYGLHAPTSHWRSPTPPPVDVNEHSPFSRDSASDAESDDLPSSGREIANIRSVYNLTRKIVKPVKPTSFLLDDSLWSNLGARHIKIRFKSCFNRGSFTNRLASTAYPSRFLGINGPAKPDHVCLIYTDNKARIIHASVSVHDVVPASPFKMGSECVILSGNRRGEVVDVVKINKKVHTATVRSGDHQWDIGVDNTCLVEPAT